LQAGLEYIPSRPQCQSFCKKPTYSKRSDRSRCSSEPEYTALRNDDAISNPANFTCSDEASLVANLCERSHSFTSNSSVSTGKPITRPKCPQSALELLSAS
jgi:hypothetical protein